jgi:DNA-binding transcriptional regulator LsrR (DeoR family)
MMKKVAREQREEKKWDFLADVADMYYLQKQTQQEIAERLGISRVMVSRSLSLAANLGVVEFRINRHGIRREDLEEELRTAFPEVEFVVVRANYHDPNRLIGQQAAAVAEKHVFDGLKLAISYGKSVFETVKAIPMHNFRSLEVVQMAGVEGAANPQIDGWELVRMCAERLGGGYQHLSASLFSSSVEVHTALVEDSKIRAIFDLAADADLAIIGVGSMNPQLSSVVRAGHVSLQKLQDAADAGSVGYIGGQHYDIYGEPIASLNSLTMSLDLNKIRDIPEVIAVAHGEAKALPLVGALRGKYLTSLVTDEVAAEGIIDFLKHSEKVPEKATSIGRVRNKRKTQNRRTVVGDSDVPIVADGKE